MHTPNSQTLYCRRVFWSYLQIIQNMMVNIYLFLERSQEFPSYSFGDSRLSIQCLVLSVICLDSERWKNWGVYVSGNSFISKNGKAERYSRRAFGPVKCKSLRESTIESYAFLSYFQPFVRWSCFLNVRVSFSCKVKLSQYTCPRCNLPYCSLECYKSTLHQDCTEAFYKDCVFQQLRADKVE